MNEVYAKRVGDRPPARSTFQVAKLPSGALVEIEAIAVTALPRPGCIDIDDLITAMPRPEDDFRQKLAAKDEERATEPAPEKASAPGKGPAPGPARAVIRLELGGGPQARSLL